MLAVYDPVLAFGLVIDRGAVGIVPAQSHTGGYEYAIDLVAHQCYGSPIGHRHIIESSHGLAAESSARGLLQVVLLAGLVIDYGYPAVGVLAETVLCGGIGITSGITGRWLHHAYVKCLAVALAHYLIERAVVGFVESTGG